MKSKNIKYLKGYKHIIDDGDVEGCGYIIPKQNIQKSWDYELSKRGEENAQNYPLITKLNIPIYYEGKIPYVLGEDIKKVLNKKQLKKFNDNHGVNTGILTKDGKFGCYLIDCEKTLKIVLENYKPSVWEWD